LCKLLIDAFRQYEQELHGEQKPARSLWDRQANGSFRPVEEDALSDHVKLFLKRTLVESGIVLNREVEIGRVPGAPIGARTDIRVDAVRRLKGGDGFDSVTAIVETKGCWHAKLFSALKDQLYKDYLVPLGAPIGIYLVGWFDKPRWDQSDRRRAKAPDMSIGVAQSQLDAQAAALPEGFTIRAVVLDCHLP
jgi:hypothetical protein